VRFLDGRVFISVDPDGDSAAGKKGIEWWIKWAEQRKKRKKLAHLADGSTANKEKTVGTTTRPIPR